MSVCMSVCHSLFLHTNTHTQKHTYLHIHTQITIINNLYYIPPQDAKYSVMLDPEKRHLDKAQDTTLKYQLLICSNTLNRI